MLMACFSSGVTQGPRQIAAVRRRARGRRSQSFIVCWRRRVSVARRECDKILDTIFQGRGLDAEKLERIQAPAFSGLDRWAGELGGLTQAAGSGAMTSGAVAEGPQSVGPSGLSASRPGGANPDQLAASPPCGRRDARFGACIDFGGSMQDAEPENYVFSEMLHVN